MSEPITIERIAKLEMLRSAVERALDAYMTSNRDEALACNHDGANLVYMANLANSAPALLAAARAHLELVSALKYLANGKDLFDLWQEDDAYFCHAPTEEAGTGWRFADRAILEHAKATGWQPPTSKESADV